MGKKIIIISSVVIALLAVGIGTFFGIDYFMNKNKGINFIPKKDVVSTIFLDINPSIAIDLDKDNKVIDVRALNDDAKEIIHDDYDSKEYNYVVRMIVEELIDKGYAKEKMTILVSTTGELSTEVVFNVIKQECDAKKIETDIIAQKISENAKEIAMQYGISEAKASYIEELLENNKELSFDDLTNKSIGELNELKNTTAIEDKKEEDKTSNNNPSTGSSGNSTSYSCTPPSNLKDGAWCEWNVKRPQNCEYDYPLKKSTSELNSLIYAHLGLSQGNINGAMGTVMAHRGTSYCETYKLQIMTTGAIYNVEIDQVTGEIVSSNKETLSVSMTEEEAKQKGLAFWHLTEEDCNLVSAHLDLNGSANGTYYRYQVNIMTKDGKNYSVDYNASTGEVVSSRAW